MDIFETVHFENWKKEYCDNCTNFECGICKRSQDEMLECYKCQWDESDDR